MDNLLAYLESHFGDQLAVSGLTGDLLLWGERVNNGVKLLGLSFNISTTAKTTQGHGDRLISSGILIAQRTNLPFVRITYPPNLYTEASSNIIIDSEHVRRDEAAAKIQAKFGTHYKLFGTSKSVNKSTNDAFQNWARDNLPRYYVRIDIDAILHTKENIPALLIEIKRSPNSQVNKWKPYIEDIRNYYIENLLAMKAYLKFTTLMHTYIDALVTDENTISIHDIQSVSLAPPRIESSKVVAKAKDVVTHLANLTN